MMNRKLVRILSLVLCLLLVFQQSGFSQVVGTLDISGYFTGPRNSFVQDKFRPLHLRFLSYDAINNNFRLLLDKGDLKDPKPKQLEDTTKTLLNYFFIGLTLPNDAFWVNLRPDSPDNIIDDFLAQTDVGRILLEADLQLKKDTAKYTSPETPEGRDYWNKLYQRAGEIFGSENITIPTLTRPWIVPDEVIIAESNDNAYIYKATLKVMLEQDYLKDSSVYNFKDDRLNQLNEYSSQLIRELVIPKLTKEINTSKRYIPLRQVYYSLILSQWFKRKFSSKSSFCSNLIDRKLLTNLTSREPWSKNTYFQAYQKSFKDGEYNIKEPVYTPYGQTIRSYFSGGANLSVIPVNPIQNQLGLIPENSHNTDLFSSEGPPGATIITDARRRDNGGRFTKEEGKSPKDMIRILSSSEYRDKSFTMQQYRDLWKDRYKDELPQSTAYSDLGGAREKGWVEPAEAENYYRLTTQGKAAVQDGVAADASQPTEVSRNDKSQNSKTPNIDNRPVEKRLLRQEYVRYDMAVKRVINPRNEDLSVLYGAAGVDISNFLLSCNSPKAYFISDYVGLTFRDFEVFFDDVRQYGLESDASVDIDSYRSNKYDSGYTSSDHLYTRMHILNALAFELQAIGVDLKTVQVDLDNEAPCIHFEWQHKDAGEKRTYSITFIDADITRPLENRILKDVLSKGIDIYYQKAAESIPEDNYTKADNFIKTVYEHLNPGGYLVTDDVAYNVKLKTTKDMSSVFPMPLPEIELPFAKRLTTDIILLREALFAEVGDVWILYGWKVRIRQKPPAATSVDGSARSSLRSPESGTTGGIDLRAMPLVTQPMLAPGANLNKPMPLSRLDNSNLDKDWQDIQNMIQAGIIPSPIRIKEYLENYCSMQNTAQDVSKVLNCIAEILRLEEEHCRPTEPAFKDLLVLIQSNQLQQEFFAALNNIEPIQREPAIKP